VADAGYTLLPLKWKRESESDIYKLDIVACIDSQPWSPEDTRFRILPTTRKLRYALSQDAIFSCWYKYRRRSGWVSGFQTHIYILRLLLRQCTHRLRGLRIWDRSSSEVASGEVDVVFGIDEDQREVPLVIPVQLVVCAVLAVSKVRPSVRISCQALAAWVSVFFKILVSIPACYVPGDPGWQGPRMACLRWASHAC